MNKEILLIGDIHKRALELLHSTGRVHQISNEQFLTNNLRYDSEVVVLRTFTPLRKEQLERLPGAKIVVNCSVGTDNMDLQEITARGIKLITCTGTNANSVAEHVIHLLFALARAKEKPPFFEFKGKTLGLLGFGNIGRLVAEKAYGLGMNIITYDAIRPEISVLEKYHANFVSLDELAERSDIISVHVPSLPSTQRLVNESLFNRMKSGSLFVNTSRSEVVDEKALIKAIQDKKLRGVALDVYTKDLSSFSFKDHNVILTDHVAARGEDSYETMCCRPIEELVKSLV